MECSGCGSHMTIEIVTIENFQYPLCPDCSAKYHSTGIIEGVNSIAGDDEGMEE